jgi:uncharacterized protein (TIGR02118 family)
LRKTLVHRLLVIYPKPADPAHFLDHYASRHVPLARTLPSLLACRWVQPQVLGPGEGTPFVLFEADFASEAAMLQTLGSPVGRELAGDVTRYSPAGATLMHFEVPA